MGDGFYGTLTFQAILAVTATLLEHCTTDVPGVLYDAGAGVGRWLLVALKCFPHDFSSAFGTEIAQILKPKYESGMEAAAPYLPPGLMPCIYFEDILLAPPDLLVGVTHVVGFLEGWSLVCLDDLAELVNRSMTIVVRAWLLFALVAWGT